MNEKRVLETKRFKVNLDEVKVTISRRKTETEVIKGLK